ncbi:hypothetical protein FIBSPDRAFT_358918 [Athelia psychrophila]|uniref:Uncharacterized protein n=1 Tax=Athelia psychrophila TaxID=1759441 RepID=A0A166PLF5_9AGAM|nr:hypothetical protein FIBSPDRAFT_358918 [Fibularhizoctonia sp. CBS 109695]
MGSGKGAGDDKARKIENTVCSQCKDEGTWGEETRTDQAVQSQRQRKMGGAGSRKEYARKLSGRKCTARSPRQRLKLANSRIRLPHKLAKDNHIKQENILTDNR